VVFFYFILFFLVGTFGGRISLFFLPRTEMGQAYRNQNDESVGDRNSEDPLKIDKQSGGEGKKKFRMIMRRFR
jgi:hypothetical protein